jgi:hypothetical protein
MSKIFKRRNRPQHKTSAGNGGRSNGYTVGYRKPPLHSQFRPGQSGNPAGRAKAVRNLSTDVRQILKAPVKVNEGGYARTASTQEGMLLKLREKALKGDARAVDRLLGLASRYNNDPGGTSVQTLDADDQAILAAYADEILSTRLITTGSAKSRPTRVDTLIRVVTAKPGERPHLLAQLSRDEEATI